VSDPCANHRGYLGAIADRELELVPAESLEHVQECPDCRRELSTHRLLGERLVQAGEPEARGQVAGAHPTGRRHARLRLSATVAALLLVLAAGGFGAARLVQQASDPTAASVSWAGAGPQLRSTDYGQIRVWCERSSGHALPYATPASLQPVGARMDRWGDQDLPTIFFETAAGEDVTVTWIGISAPSPQQGSIETRQDGGQSLLLVRGPTGTMVVRGNTGGATLWSAAADLAAASP
jgi:hypothetical protein